MADSKTARSGELAGLTIVHAATSANMLTAFGRVMASRIVEEGAEFYLLASSRPIYGRPADLDELREMGGRPLTVPLDNNIRPWNLLRNTFRLWRLFRHLRPDIVHTRASVMGIVGRLAAWLARVPVVVHHQDDLHAREANLSPVKRRISTAVERSLANRSDQTFVVSQALADAAEQAGFDPNRVTNVGHDLSFTIRDGARNPPDPTSINELLGQYGIDTEHFVVGAITRLEPHKGVDTLIEAAVQVIAVRPNIRFVIRGRGPERDHLRRLIAEKDLAEQVVLIEDWLSDDDLVALYQRFNLFALPTRREGFGMAFAEAMLLGAVPVAPDIAPVNEVVTPGNGFLAPPDPVSFADAILESTSEGIDLDKFVQRAKLSATERWGRESAANKVISKYKEISKASGLSPRKKNFL